SRKDGSGPLEGRPGGELYRDDEVALGLRRNEARRDGPEPDHDETEQQGIGSERKGGSAYQAADGPSIAMAGPLEDPVEHAEEPAEEAVPQASEPVLLGALGLEEERAHRRAQRERVERRQYGRHGDREGELPIELARDAREERRRHEDRRETEGDRDDRTRHLVHGAVRGLARREALGDVALDVLDHHDREIGRAHV